MQLSYVYDRKLLKTGMQEMKFWKAQYLMMWNWLWRLVTVRHKQNHAPQFPRFPQYFQRQIRPLKLETFQVGHTMSTSHERIRTELISKIEDLLSAYVHWDNDALPTLVQDLIHSKKWSSTFGTPEIKGDPAIPSKLLLSIVKRVQRV